MAKERDLYSSRLTPGRSTSSQDTSSDYGRINRGIHSNFHFAEGPNPLYAGRRSALDEPSPINKPLVSLDVNMDVSFALLFFPPTCEFFFLLSY